MYGVFLLTIETFYLKKKLNFIESGSQIASFDTPVLTILVCKNEVALT